MMYENADYGLSLQFSKKQIEVVVFRIVLFSFHLFFLGLKERNFLILSLG